MGRRVYFAFHYQNDIWRVNVVRNSWVTHPDRETAGFYDASLWEKAKKTGPNAIKRMINDGLKGSSVTAFLLGSETAGRPWVQYELERSHAGGKGLLAIHIHGIEDRLGYRSQKGDNILSYYTITVNGAKRYLSDLYETYDWVADRGYTNLGTWVERAARLVSR